MVPLRLDLSLPRRAFDVALALDVGAETFALVGPSGAGKTSVLRAVAGLTRPERGTIGCGDDIWFDADRRINLRPEQRSVGYVFQEYALFPHLTVRQNVAFGGGAARVDRLLWRLGIEDLAGAKPTDLSGGERQRVALARALAREPRVLLLDEPMAALDPHTRGSVRSELHDLLRELALPTLLVTHDFEDAAALADRVGVLAEGRLRQVGSPADLLGAPADPFVAQLAGANVLSGVAARAAGGLTAVLLDAGPTIYAADETSGRTEVVVYPWDVSLAREPPDDSALNHLRDEIVSLTPLGNRARVRLRLLTAEITTASLERLQLATGEPVVASFKATQARLLPREPAG
jgi:molybdate transport system ATP-binding protein